jgi:CheY-like chemotaxis protein
MYELTQRQRNDIEKLVEAKGPHLRHIEPPAIADLVQRILADDCIALVGAGFSALVSPQWGALIERAATLLDQAIPEDASQLVSRYLEGRRYEPAAEVLRDAAGETAFNGAIADALREAEPGEGTAEMACRVDLLAGIPFRGVLTTNFDGRPPGRQRDQEAYRSLLRTEQRRQVPDPTPGRGSMGAVQLHGSIEGSADDLVVTSRQYRNLLHSSPGYRTFLRSLMATRTLLLLGKSFEDEYLNDLRSEVLALFRHSPSDPPVAFASMHAARVDQAEADYLRKHEGIEILRYGDPNSRRDHSGFDALLDVLYQATNYVARTRRLLRGRHVLWLDTNKSGWGHADVRYVIGELETGDGSVFTLVDDPVETLRALGENQYDLLITNWGWRPDGDPIGLTVLRRVHSERHDVPVVVFAAPGHPENRATAMRAGAADFVTTHLDLYERIYTIVDAVALND